MTLYRMVLTLTLYPMLRTQHTPGLAAKEKKVSLHPGVGIGIGEGAHVPLYEVDGTTSASIIKVVEGTKYQCLCDCMTFFLKCRSLQICRLYRRCTFHGSLIDAKKPRIVLQHSFFDPRIARRLGFSIERTWFILQHRHDKQKGEYICIDRMANCNY